MQKLKDFAQFVQGSRAAKLSLIGAGIAVVLLFLAEGGPPQRIFRTPPTRKIDSSGVRETQSDIYDSLRSKIENLQTQNKVTQEEVLKTSERVRDMEQQTAEILKKMLTRISEIQSTGGQNGLPVAEEVGSPVEGISAEGGVDPVTGKRVAKKSAELEEFLPQEPEVAPPVVPETKKIAFVGPGDSVRVKLLAGVNAPTDGTPYPVVFKLVGDVHGPDGSTLPLGEARLMAAAQGSLTDSRALFRLTTLNISLPSGERKVLDVDGWIVGEDGIRGMSGMLIDPIGKAIGGAITVGGIQGMGQAIQQANSTTYVNGNGGLSTVVTGNRAEFAAGSALSAGANEWGGIIRDRLSQLTPVVKVYSGREGTAVFAKNLNIEGLLEALQDQNGSDPGLD